MSFSDSVSDDSFPMDSLPSPPKTPPSSVSSSLSPMDIFPAEPEPAPPITPRPVKRISAWEKAVATSRRTDSTAAATTSNTASPTTPQRKQTSTLPTSRQTSDQTPSQQRRAVLPAPQPPQTPQPSTTTPITNPEVAKPPAISATPRIAASPHVGLPPRRQIPTPMPSVKPSPSVSPTMRSAHLAPPNLLTTAAAAAASASSPLAPHPQQSTTTKQRREVPTDPFHEQIARRKEYLIAFYIAELRLLSVLRTISEVVMPTLHEVVTTDDVAALYVDYSSWVLYSDHISACIGSVLATWHDNCSIVDILTRMLPYLVEIQPTALTFPTVRIALDKLHDSQEMRMVYRKILRHPRMEPYSDVAQILQIPFNEYQRYLHFISQLLTSGTPKKHPDWKHVTKLRKEFASLEENYNSLLAHQSQNAIVFDQIRKFGLPRSFLLESRRFVIEDECIVVITRKEKEPEMPIAAKMIVFSDKILFVASTSESQQQSQQQQQSSNNTSPSQLSLHLPSQSQSQSSQQPQQQQQQQLQQQPSQQQYGPNHLNVRIVCCCTISGHMDCWKSSEIGANVAKERGVHQWGLTLALPNCTTIASFPTVARRNSMLETCLTHRGKSVSSHREAFIERHIQSILSQRKESGVYISVQDASHCSLCKREFTFMVSKFHCKFCLRPVCRQCGSFKFNFDTEQVRICDLCRP